MESAGAVVGTLDQIKNHSKLSPGRLTDLAKQFGFLTGNNLVKDHLESVISAERDWILKNEEDQSRRYAMQEGLKSPISNIHLLSKSFLSNQISGHDIVCKKKPRPSVSNWIVSATFSFVSITVKKTSRTYGFIQTFPLSDHFEYTRPMTEVQRRKQSAAPALARQQSVRKKAQNNTSQGRAGRDEKEDSPSAGPMTGDEDEGEPGGFRTKFRSALPPDLELELELLSKANPRRR